MTAILVGNNIAPHRFKGDEAEDASALLVVSGTLLWWVHLAWAIIGFVRIYLVFEDRPREVRLLQDLVVGVVYLGVVAIALGLALQNTGSRPATIRAAKRPNEPPREPNHRVEGAAHKRLRFVEV
jgi:hypothetical protein